MGDDDSYDDLWMHADIRRVADVDTDISGRCGSPGFDLSMYPLPQIKSSFASNVTTLPLPPIPSPSIPLQSPIPSVPNLAQWNRRKTKPVPPCPKCNQTYAVKCFSGSGRKNKYCCGSCTKDGQPLLQYQWSQIPVYKLQPGEDPCIKETYGQIDYRLAGTEKTPFGNRCSRCGELKKNHVCKYPNTNKKASKRKSAEDLMLRSFSDIEIPALEPKKNDILLCPLCNGEFCLISNSPIKFRCTSDTRKRHKDSLSMMTNASNVSNSSTAVSQNGYTSDTLGDLFMNICDLCEEIDADDEVDKMCWCVCNRGAHMRCKSNHGDTYKCLHCYCTICKELLDECKIFCYEKCGRSIHKSCSSSHIWTCLDCTSLENLIS